MNDPADELERRHRNFRWRLPDRFNIGVAVCDAWARRDQAVMDEDGYVRFAGRNDDLITSAGYRIGPGEIEDCLGRHPAVAMAAAVGKPDPLRTEIVKAFLVLKPGYELSDMLTAEIQAFVRTRLSAHEYPREVDYVADLPLTSTGKIIRGALRESAGRATRQPSPARAVP